MIYKAPRRMTPLVAVVLQSRMIEAPCSYDALIKMCGLSKPAVARWVKTMRAAGFVHVAGYGPDKTGRAFTPLWAWGRGLDAARPGPTTTAAERMRAIRAKAKSQS